MVLLRSMKALLVLLVTAALVAIDAKTVSVEESLTPLTSSSTPSPVTVTMLSPVAGSTVSNTITLSADASSLAGPIMRVEFYVDGQLVGTVTNRPPSPTGLRTVSP